MCTNGSHTEPKKGKQEPFIRNISIRATKQLISIIITKRILHYLQKWDLKYSVYPLHGQEFSDRNGEWFQTKQDWHSTIKYLMSV